MPVSPQLKKIGQMLSSLSGYGRPVDPSITQEILSVPTTFDFPGTSEPLWEEDATYNVVPKGGDVFNFRAFIDGVQRTSVVYWLTLEELGSMIPIVMGHIAAGVTIRDNERKLRVDRTHIRDRILLLMPLKGMIKAGFDGGSIIEDWIKNGHVVSETKISENPLEGLAYDNPNPPLILCDTTFNNISRTPESENDLINKSIEGDELSLEKPSTLLIDQNLYNISKIRGRAQGRINTIRQILEMLVLAKYREKYTNYEPVLVDGPLFFLGKWLRKYDVLKSYSDSEREKYVLNNAVGIVKTLKTRPKETVNLKHILNLKDGEYSRVMKIHDAVDIHGDNSVSEGYLKPHVTAYLRFKTPPGFIPPSQLGLVRVDLHMSTLGAETLDEATTDKVETTKRMNTIVKGVIREKLPGISQTGRSFTEAYPIKETEMMLHSRLYSTLEMKYLYSMIRSYQ